MKDPTRKLKIPKNLRPKDKGILSWDQMWSILAGTARRDRLLLILDMTEALRPSELFALRWRSFDGHNTLSISETVYRRKIRSFGKTPGSLGKVHLPDDLASELRRWKLECKDRSPETFIFPNSEGGFIDAANYRFRVLKPLAKKLGIPRLNFQTLRRTMATQAQRMGSVKDDPGAPPSLAARHHGQRVHAGVAGKRPGDGRIGVRKTQGRRGIEVGSLGFATKCYQSTRTGVSKLLIPWWALQDSNLRLPPCEGGTLPLS